MPSCKNDDGDGSRAAVVVLMKRLEVAAAAAAVETAGLGGDDAARLQPTVASVLIS